MTHYIFGEIVEKKLEIADLEEIFSQIAEKKSKLADYPPAKILAVLEQCGKIWQNPEYPGRKIALTELPAIVKFSPQMVELGIKQLIELLKPENLEQKILSSLGKLEYLEGWTDSDKGFLRAAPLGTVLHISAGNVFLGAVDSLVHGFLSKNINLLKLSNQDPLFPLLFARSIKEADPEGILAASFCILSFKGGETEIEDFLKTNCNGIVVWGGEEAVKAYRQKLPLSCKLIEYGPKYSFSLLTQKALESLNQPEGEGDGNELPPYLKADKWVNSPAELAKLLARDIVLWEQRACSSPQVIFLPEAFAESIGLELREALKSLAKKLPPPPPLSLSIADRLEITRAREEAEFAKAEGKGQVYFEPDNLDYTVIIQEEEEFLLPPLNRVIYLKAYRDFSGIKAFLSPIQGNLQAAGVFCRAEEFSRLCQQLQALGTNRIVPVGEMQKVYAASPHDGSFQLEQLINWVNIEEMPLSFTREQKFFKLLARVKADSPFYREKFSRIEVKSLTDLPKLPLIDSEELRANIPVYGEDFFCPSPTSPASALVFASGGTGGEPRLAYYTGEDWERVTETLAEVYLLAGVKSGDKVANLFMAGNLWSSFMAANRALEKLGALIFPIGGNAEPEQMVKFIRKLKPDIFIGLPTILLEIARLMKEQGLKLKAVLYGGERLNSSARKFLKQVFAPDRIISAGYASVDAGVIGFQTPHCPGSVHHLLWDSQLMELIDPETKKAAPEGEIVISNLDKKFCPVIRYRTGDRGKWVECPCGREEPAFDLEGRISEVIRAGSVDLKVAEIEKALEFFPEISPVFQLEITSRGEKEYVKLKLEIEKGDIIELPNLLREKLLEINPELKEALERRWLSRLVVQAGFPGSIPRVKRTGKVTRVLDLREK